jgi:hypothetical protein
MEFLFTHLESEHLAITAAYSRRHTSFKLLFNYDAKLQADEILQ